MSIIRHAAILVSNSVPNAPALGARANFDAAFAALFTWTHTDPDGDAQNGYQILIKRVSDGVTVYDSGTVLTSTQSHNLAPATLVNNVNYQWQVRTQDAEGFGVYSGLQAFSTSQRPVAVVTNPAINGAVIGQANLDVTFTYADPEGGVQTAYQVIVNDGASNVFDSGKVASAAVHRMVGGLLNGGAYTITVYVWDVKDVQSAAATRTFTVSFTAPNIPVVTLSDVPAGGYILVSIDNPVPSGGAPAVAYNDIYRRKLGDVLYERIATLIPNDGTYRDYTAQSAQTYEYRVLVYGTNATVRIFDAGQENLTLAGVWIHDPLDPIGTVKNFLLDGKDSDSQLTIEMERLFLAGRAQPVVEYGDTEDFNVRQVLQLKKTLTEYQDLERLVRLKSILCYRDSRKRKLFGTINVLPKSDGLVIDEATVSVDVADYNEFV